MNYLKQYLKNKQKKSKPRDISSWLNIFYSTF